MNNNFDSLIDLLKTDERYVAEDGDLLKAKVYQDAMMMEENLLNLLLSQEETKEAFFTKVGNTLVFDKYEFAWLINSKEFLPDSYTAYTNKIGLATNRKFISQADDVVLDFPYKDAVLAGGQDKEDQKRDEIMFHSILAREQIMNMLTPKVFTNAKRYTTAGDKDLEGKLIPDTIEVKEELATEFKEDDNLIIKGNNLIALSSLLERYEGKVKLIYIDPPYNTGSDSFNYNDQFNHSTWLTFMKNRLEIAWRLLAEDGAIYVQTDDKEHAYLKVLMDEIFGEGSYLNTIVLKSKASSGASGGGEDKRLKKNCEFILLYTKELAAVESQKYAQPLTEYIAKRREEGKNFAYIYVMVDSGNLTYIGEAVDGSGQKIELYEVDNYEIKTVKQMTKEEGISEEEVYLKYFSQIFTTENAQTSIRTRVRNAANEEDYVIARYIPISGRNKGKVTDVGFIGKTKRLVSYLSATAYVENGVVYKTEQAGTLWDDISWSQVKAQGGNIDDFGKGKKPESLLERIISQSTSERDIVLDFFMGSATTQAVAMKMNRRFIGIEQMDYVDTIAVPRLKNILEGEQSGISQDVNWQGGGSFVYCELKEDGQTLIDAIQASDENTIGEIKNYIYQDERIVPYLTTQELEKVDNTFEHLDIDDKKKALIELIDKNKLYVNYASIDDEDYDVSDEDKSFSCSFYEGVR